MVQCGGIISANIYRANDAPSYRRGNRNLVIINVLAILLFIFTIFYYITKNRARDRRWKAMTHEVSACFVLRIDGSFADEVQERIHYMRTTTDTASRRSDFRFAHSGLL